VDKKLIRNIQTLAIAITGYGLLLFLPFPGALPLGVFLAFWANNIEQNDRLGRIINEYEKLRRE